MRLAIELAEARSTRGDEMIPSSGPTKSADDAKIQAHTEAVSKLTNTVSLFQAEMRTLTRKAQSEKYIPPRQGASEDGPRRIAAPDIDKPHLREMSVKLPAKPQTEISTARPP